MKKNFLANFLDSILPDFLLPSIKKLLPKKLTVLAYHRISNALEDEYSFDYELISADVENFEFQMQHIIEHFNPISTEQLIEYIEGHGELPVNPILITFDDGFDDNYLFAFPVLKKYNVPATIFIASKYIGTDEVFWFDKLIAVLLNMDSGELCIEELNNSYKLNDNRNERKEIAYEILSAIKTVPNSIRKAILTKIYKSSGNTLQCLDYTQSKILSWSQVREMYGSGISFGSHTMTHPILAMLDDDEMKSELINSKKQIEKEIGCVIDSIAYPNGGVDDFNNQVIKTTKESGYKVGFSYIEDLNKLPLVDAYTIRRLHIETHVSKSYFKFLLCLPSLFSTEPATTVKNPKPIN